MAALETIKIDRHGKLDGDTQIVNDASNYVEIYKIIAESRSVVLTLTVGSAGALAGLKVTQATCTGGTHRDLSAGTDFNTSTVAIPWCLPTNPHLAAADAVIQMRLQSGAWEYSIWAKKSATNTTLTLEGTAIPQYPQVYVK